MNVLIVEDDENSRIMLQEVLNSSGYSVEFGSNGFEALAKLKRSQPDLIISDILMPKMDGFELCRRIKKDKHYQSIPFVFYTATYTDAKDEKFALSLGASKFLIKPMEPLKFISMVSDILREQQGGKSNDLLKPKLSNQEFDQIHASSLNRKLDKKIEDLEKEHKLLQQSETRFRDLFDSSPISILEQDFSGVWGYFNDLKLSSLSNLNDILSGDPQFLYNCEKRITNIDVNNSALQLFNANTKQELFKNISSMFATEYQIILRKAFNAIWHNHYQFKIDSSFTTLAGQRRDVEIRWSVSNGKEQDYSRVLVCIIDITERNQAKDAVRKLNTELEQRVSQRTAELEQALKELKSFSYSVSHDLRSPLRSINGYSTLLLEDYDQILDDNGKKYLDRVCAASKRMGMLIDDLLTLSQITMEDVQRQSIDMSELAQDILTELREREPDRQVQINITPELIVNADQRLLHIMLENLLGNAWKFTSKNSETKIVLGQTEKKGKHVYYVKDNGAGFDMRYKDKVFDAFQRLHKQDEFPGTGIGLATVVRILERHRNEIWAESELNKGATFYFTLD